MENREITTCFYTLWKTQLREFCFSNASGGDPRTQKKIPQSHCSTLFKSSCALRIFFLSVRLAAEPTLTLHLWPSCPKWGRQLHTRGRNFSPKLKCLWLSVLDLRVRTGQTYRRTDGHHSVTRPNPEECRIINTCRSLVHSYLPDVFHGTHLSECNARARSLHENIVNRGRVVEHGGADHSKCHCAKHISYNIHVENFIRFYIAM